MLLPSCVYGPLSARKECVQLVCVVPDAKRFYHLVVVQQTHLGNYFALKTKENNLRGTVTPVHNVKISVTNSITLKLYAVLVTNPRITYKIKWNSFYNVMDSENLHLKILPMVPCDSVFNNSVQVFRNKNRISLVSRACEPCFFFFSRNVRFI